MTGMIKGFLGFEIFDCRIFLVGKFGKYFLGWLDLIRHFFLLFQNNLKIHGIAAYAGCILLQIRYHQTFLFIQFV